jgi:NADH-quinone oxidoreductase subunit J
MTLDIVLLALVLVAAVWTVMARGLLGAAIGLGITSLLLSLVLFQLHAPWAAAFELSVCAGLITVVFASAVALTRARSAAETADAANDRWKRYIALPILLVAVALGLAFGGVAPHTLPALPAAGRQAAGDLLWNSRPTDVLGQVLVLVTGALGVVVLFKQRGKDA